MKRNLLSALSELSAGNQRFCLFRGETRLAKAGSPATVRGMTLLQIQRKVKALPRSERLALSAYLKHLSRAESESNKRSLDAAAGRMAKGEKVTRAQLQRLHKSLRTARV